MNLTRQMKGIEDIYVNQVITEKSDSKFAKGSFEVVSKKESSTKKQSFVDQKKTGPENASGANVKAKSDPKHDKNKETFQGSEKLSAQNFKENVEKSESDNINNFMSKSIFDKLFEDVMGAVPSDEQDALTLGAAPGSEEHAGDEQEGGEEEVSFSLPRELAQKLHDALGEVLSSEDHGEEDLGGEGDLGGEDKAEEAKPEQNEEIAAVAGEATEMTELKTSAGESLQKKDNKVGDTTNSLVAKGEGDGKVKGEVDGKGKDLPTSAGAKLQSKGSQKVAGKASSTGHYIFQK